MTGKSLKIIRLFHKRKQDELALNLGISHSYLSEIESCKKEVTLDILKKYSDYFQIPMSDLMFFSEKLEDNSISERFRKKYTTKLKKIMEWVIAKDDHLGTK
jgi:transcriptional regulator with XRE-family HTH domain